MSFHLRSAGVSRMKRKPAAPLRSEFTDVVFAPSRKLPHGFPPHFESRGRWVSTAHNAKNGTALNEANKGHAKHGGKPDGAADRPERRRSA